MEYPIGATQLRQKLTDVLLAVREKHATYVIETSGRPQAALISMDEYRAFQQYRRERGAFFRWFDKTAAANARRNASLSDRDLPDIGRHQDVCILNPGQLLVALHLARLPFEAVKDRYSLEALQAIGAGLCPEKGTSDKLQRAIALLSE